MSRNIAYLANTGKHYFCLSGGGGVLPVWQNARMAENRIKTIRKSRGMTLEDLAAAVELSVPYVQRLENGDRNLAVKHFDAFAAALGVSARDLVAAGANESSDGTVKVVGRVGAGSEILPEYEQVPPEGLFEISIPFPVPDNALAFEVEGDSMWPRYDPGDVILCWREGTNANEVIGWEAAVRTADGKRYLKRITKGSRLRHFDLESFNAPVIRNVKLEWISKVQLVVRAGEWKQIGRAVQKRIEKKLAAAR
jgi:transcriptional regulator with XRE-family HTH domain